MQNEEVQTADHSSEESERLADLEMIIQEKDEMIRDLQQELANHCLSETDESQDGRKDRSVLQVLKSVWKMIFLTIFNPEIVM